MFIQGRDLLTVVATVRSKLPHLNLTKVNVGHDNIHLTSEVGESMFNVSIKWKTYLFSVSKWEKEATVCK